MELPKILKSAQDDGLRIVMTNGVFDVLHAGHIEHLQAAAAEGVFLAIAVNSDSTVRRLKGCDRPINSAEDRMAVLSALRCVDAVFEFDQLNAALAIELVRPSVYVKGGDYTWDKLAAEEREVITRLKVLTVFTRKTSYTSTAIIKRAQFQINAYHLADVAISTANSCTASIDDAARDIVASLRDGGKILTCGNGGSAADALHFAQELTGRYKVDRRALAGICLNADPCAMTCIGNDYSFKQIFSRQVEALGRPGDVLVAFSTSGQSANVITAIEAAYAAGMKVILLTGWDGGKAAGRCLHNVVVPSTNTARIQEIHTMIFHTWLDAIDAAFQCT